MNWEKLDLNRLKDLDIQSLKSLFEQIFDDHNRSRTSTDFILGNIYWAIQAQQSGLNHNQLRKKLLSSAKNRSISHKTQYLPGTRLVREWYGNTYEVVVEDKGFYWNGRHYQSLSQIAREITGARWSGPRFFGIKK